MSYYQISALALLTVYYAAYLTKLFGQRRKGIKTVQLGKGEKSRRTVIVENILQITSCVAIVAEGVSIIFNSGWGLPSLLRITGIFCTGCGTIIFILAMVTMRDSWRAGIPTTDETKLVTKGIYRISRNPAFLGFDLVYLGVGIAFFNVVLAVITLMGIVVLHHQILEEENFLSKVFGPEYETYKKQVGRYILKI